MPVDLAASRRLPIFRASPARTGDVRWPRRDTRRRVKEPVSREPAAWAPPVDIEETDDAYVIEAEIPGVKREDVNIELVGTELTVSGEIKERERTGILRRRTRKVGQFELRVTLPDYVDGERVDAKLDNGVLTVRVPKAERAQRRKIELKS